MATPIHFKLVLPILAGQNQRYAVLTYSLPDTHYAVEVSTDWSCGSWWMSDKSTSKFKLHFETAPGSTQNASVFIYWGG